MAMTPRLKKVLLVGVAGVLVACVAAALILPRLIDVNSYRPKIESLAREKLGRDVTIGELGLSVFPVLVVTVDGVRVGAADEAPLLEAEGVRLRAELGPLLAGRLAIGQVIVEKPTITLRRRASGELELAELLGGGSGGSDAGRVSLEGLRIEGGRVVFEDAAVKPGSLVRHELSELDLDVAGLDRLEKPMQVELSARVPSLSPDARVAWSGTLGIDSSARGRLELVAVELKALSAHAGAFASRDLSALAGRVDSTLEIEREADGSLAIEGTLAAKGLVLPREGAAPWKLLDSTLALDLDARTPGRMVLDRFDLGVGALTLSGKGSLETEGAERRLALELPVTSLRLDELSKLALQAGIPLPLEAVKSQSVLVGGKLRAVATVEGGFALKRLDIDGLTLEGLRLALTRGEDGRFDFRGGQAPAKSETKARSAKSAGLEIAARDISLRDLSIHFEDRGLNGSPVVTEVTDLALSIERWLPGETTPVRLSGRLAGGKASLEGSVGPLAGERMPVDLLCKLENLDIAAVAPYLAHHAGLNVERGRLQLESRLKGDKETTLAIKGRLAMEKATVTIEGREPLSLDLTIDHEVSIEEGGDRLRLREITLGLPGGPVGFDGLIDLPEGGQPSFDVGTRGKQRLTTSDLRYLIGLFGAETGLGLDAGEPLVLDARLKKRGSKFEVAGSAELRKLIVQHALLGDTALRVASADVKLSGDKVELEQILLQLGESDLSGSLSLEGFDQHRVRFDLLSKKADLDELFAFAGRTGAGEGAEAKAADGSDALGRTTATGRLRVDQATLKSLEFKSLDAQVSLADRRLSLKPARVLLYGGNAQADLTADLAASPVAYDMSGSLASVAVRDLLVAGLGYQDLSGVGGGSLRLSGLASAPEAALAAAKGGGKLELKDGVVGGLNMLGVLQQAGVFGEHSLAELGARLSQEGTSFERLDADYSLSGGVLQIERLFTETPDAKVTAKGPVQLIQQSLDLDVVVTFQKELSEKMRAEGSRAAQYFWSDRDQGVRIPLKITGPIASPKGLIDWQSAIAQAAKGELGRQLEGVLGGLLGGGRGESRESEPAKPAGEPARPAGEPPGTSTKGETRTPDPTPSATPVSASLSVDLRRVRSSGNFLVPDVKVEAQLSGTDLSHALIVVSDGSGRELHREQQAFKAEVDAHYAGGADRASPTSLEVAWKLDGERVAGKKDLKVTVTPISRKGSQGAAVSKAVEAKKLF